MKSDSCKNGYLLKVLSIHWGFSLGGVGKYALIIDRVSKIAPISIKSAVVIGRDWQTDSEGLKELNAEKIWIKSRLDMSWAGKVIRIIKKENPDLIMGHGFNGHFVNLVAKIISRHNIPLISSYHGSYHATTHARKYFEKPFNLLTEYYIRRKAKHVLAVAEYSKKYLIDKGVPVEKIVVVHNGIEYLKVDQDARARLRTEWKVSDGDVLLGVASRLDPVKGIEFLIQAASILSKKYNNLRLVIIGTGTLDDYLKKRVHDVGLSDKVFFTGFRSDVRECLNAFDIFVLPSLAEYHSIGLLEAMCAAKAIVATDVGGNMESVRHEQEGFIVPPSDTQRLAWAIERFLKTPTLCQKMGNAAQKRFCKEFTQEIMIEKTAAWLLSCGEK